MKETRVSFSNLLPQQKEQVRALLASAGGNPGGDIVEVVILTRPFNEETLRQLMDVVPSHPPTRTYREDALGDRVTRPDFDPDGDDDAWH